MSQAAEIESAAFEQAVRGVPHRDLPVLDLSALTAGDTASIHGLAGDLRQIVSEIGFLCVVNHGVPDAAITRMLDRSAALLDAVIHVSAIGGRRRMFADLLRPR